MAEDEVVYSHSEIDLIMPYFPVFLESHSSTNVLDPSVSAIFGGSNPVLLPDEEWPRCGRCKDILIPYIEINVSSPHTPDQFRQKVGIKAEPGHSVLLQVFICADDEGAYCFRMQLTVNNDEALLVRVIQVAPGLENTGAVEAAHAQLDADRYLIARRVVSGWTPGNPEMEHEVFNRHFTHDDLQYLDHEPAHGLKLLGYPVLGTSYQLSMLHPVSVRSSQLTCNSIISS